MRIIYFLFLLIVFASCSDDTMPKEIIPPKQMQAVLWDYVKTDIYTKDFIEKDSTKNPIAENIRLQTMVFSNHKVTKDQFYKSYDYYLNHPALMTVLLDSMIAIQQRKQTAVPDTIKAGKKNKLQDLKIMNKKVYE